MICPTCKSDGVQVHLLSGDYWYCRTCKDEIVLELLPREHVDFDLLAEFERLVAEGDVDSENYKPNHSGYPDDLNDDEDIQ